MINVSGITKRYGDRVAVDNMTVDVAAGNVTGFVGPNGAAKSTAMRMMVGLTDEVARRPARNIGIDTDISTVLLATRKRLGMATWLIALVVLVLSLASCTDDDPAVVTGPLSATSASVPDGTSAAVEVPVLLDDESPRDAIVVGFVVWDDESARLCEMLAESYPAQCGGTSVVIADPTNLDTVFDEAQGVRWTPNPIEVPATFDGTQLIIG